MFAEMAAPSKAICVNGSTTPPRAGQLPFPGMSKLCSAEAPAASGLPWLMHIFSGRGLDADQFSCQPEIGEVECPKLPDMEQKIAAFLLGRGDYAYMGYSCKPPRYRCHPGCILPNTSDIVADRGWLRQRGALALEQQRRHAVLGAEPLEPDDGSGLRQADRSGLP